MNSSNGKRMQTNTRMKENQTSPPVSQQEEIIKFIFDSWNKVCMEYQKGNAQGTPTVAYHTGETDPNPMLQAKVKGRETEPIDDVKVKLRDKQVFPTKIFRNSNISNKKKTDQSKENVQAGKTTNNKKSNSISYHSTWKPGGEKG